jgi:hypothetical protein
MNISIAEILRRYRRAIATWLRYFSGQSDVNRWDDPSALWPEWDDRTRLMVTLIEPGSSVLEFGAGRMATKEFLPEGCSYTPSDIVDRGEDTIVCDLNAPQLPDLPFHDVALLSGVIEYVNDVPRLLTHLSGIVKIILVSYSPCESFIEKIERRSHGWVNDFSEPEFEKLFANIGFYQAATTSWKKQKIIKFVKS